MAAFSAPRTAAVVVGAGPAGIAAVGALAARRLRVTWIDPAFRVGAFDTFRQVPANTKIDVLRQSLPAFVPQGIPDGAAAAAFEQMLRTGHALPYNPVDTATKHGWTGIGSIGEYLGAVAAELTQLEHVSCLRGRVTALQRGREHWSLSVGSDDGSADPSVRAPAVVLAVGGSPVSPPADLMPEAWAPRAGDPSDALTAAAAAAAAKPRVLPAEDVLDLDQLRSSVARHETVGVVGGGHTGVYVAQALHETLGVRCVRLFVRRPLALACWDAQMRGYGAWGFRGLKGASAAFALRHGLVGLPPPNGLVEGSEGRALGDGRLSGRLEVYHSSTLATCARAGDLDAVTYCLGYKRARLPRLLTADGELLRTDALRHTTPGGALFEAPPAADRASDSLAGLYGVGIGFADREMSSGEPYDAVGFGPIADRAAEIAAAIEAEAEARSRRRLARRTAPFRTAAAACAG